MATIKDTYVLEVKTDAASRGISSVSGAAGGLASKLKGLGPLAVAATAALGGMAAISGIKNTIDDMDDLAKAARQAGSAADAVSFEQFQVFGKLLGEAGVGADRFALAVSQTQDRLAKGGGKVDGVIEKLGESIKGMNGEFLAGPELLEKMIVAFNQGEISAAEFQATVGTKVGPEIIRALGDTAASADTLKLAMQDVAENSNIVDLEAAQNAESFNDTMTRLGEVAGRLGTEIASRLLPVLMNLAEGALTILPSIIDGVSAAFDAMKPIIDALMPVVGALFDLLQALWPVFETLLSFLTPVIEAIGTGLKFAIEGVTVVIEGVINAITRMVEGLQNIAAKVGEISSAVGQKWNNMTDGMTAGAKNAYDGVTGWFGSMYNEVVGNSIIPDMSDDVLDVFDFMNKGMVDKTASGAQGVAKGFDNIASSIGSGFNAYASSALRGVDSLVDQITGGMYSKINNLSQSVSSSFGGIVQSVSGIFGGGGGGGGFLDNVIGGIGDLFGGFFADGGTLPAGKFGVVGERGPELITGPANITPFDQMGGQQQVIYNINAVDARSFRDMLARDPGYIHALAQKGGSRVPGRFA